jgi:hypothetical protein
VNSARQDHFELRSGVLEISDKVGAQSLQIDTLKTEVFKLKEDNSAQSDQISELRAKLEANRESAEKAHAAQALVIENLTAEVRAGAEKLAALFKTHSVTTQQLETLSTAVAKQESAQPVSVAPSPFLHANNAPNTQGSAPSPFLHAGDIQWPAGYGGDQQQRLQTNPSGSSTISLPIAPTAPSPLIRSIAPAPAPVMMAAPAQNWSGPTQTLSTPAQSWVSGPTQTFSTPSQGWVSATQTLPTPSQAWVSGPTQTLSAPSQSWVSAPAAQTLSAFGVHPQSVITFR